MSQENSKVDNDLLARLKDLARARIASSDPSHDFGHALRVMENGMEIARAEGGDEQIVVPAALLHDVITYAKDDPRSALAQQESAELAMKVLRNLQEFPVLYEAAAGRGQDAY